MNETPAPSIPAIAGEPDGAQVLKVAKDWLDARHGVAIATVVETWGSSPRQPGSLLAVRDDGAFVGSVSGGCVEGAVIHTARRLIREGGRERMTFGVSNEDAFAVGLACGGTVRVLVEPLQEAQLPPAIADALLQGLAAGRSRVLATALEDEAHRVVDPLSLAPEDAFARGVNASLRADRAVIGEAEGREWLFNPFSPQRRLFVVGAVHIAQTLAPMAALAGLAVTLVDHREPWATAERFPGVRVLSEWPADALHALDLDARSAVVTLTHNPTLDDPALEAALASDAFYIGALGSQRTHARRVARLTERGWTAAQIARIHAPVGLDIGARKPAHIAVSILAEIVAAMEGALESKEADAVS